LHEPEVDGLELPFAHAEPRVQLNQAVPATPRRDREEFLRALPQDALTLGVKHHPYNVVRRLEETVLELDGGHERVLGTVVAEVVAGVGTRHVYGAQGRQPDYDSHDGVAHAMLECRRDPGDARRAAG